MQCIMQAPLPFTFYDYFFTQYFSYFVATAFAFDFSDYLGSLDFGIEFIG